MRGFPHIPLDSQPIALTQNLTITLEQTTHTAANNSGPRATPSSPVAPTHYRYATNNNNTTSVLHITHAKKHANNQSQAIERGITMLAGKYVYCPPRLTLGGRYRGLILRACRLSHLVVPHLFCPLKHDQGSLCPAPGPRAGARF